MSPTVLIVPGWGDSGPKHWQTLWEQANPGFRRVVQRNWEYPICAEWVEGLDGAIRATDGPVVLIAHSLGCLAVAHWARTATRPVEAALLVVPPDVEHPEFPPLIEGFAPIPRERLAFPSIVVSSRNDQFSDFERGRALAEAWGSRFVDAGHSGHLNPDAGFGPWPLGETLFAELTQGAAASRRRSES